MMKMKTAIKFELYNLFVEGFLVYEDFIKYWNTVKFLSKKDVNIWFNSLMAYAQPEVRELYNN